MSKIIAFEGIDGCGKSSTIKYILSRLQKEHPQLVVAALDIFTDDIGKRAKEIISKSTIPSLESIIALLDATTHTLYHVVPEILAYNKDCIILLDRGRASFYAYQVAASGFEDYLRGLSEFIDIEDFRVKLNLNYVYLKSSPKRCDELMQGRENLTVMDNREYLKKRASYNGYTLYFDRFVKHGHGKVLTIDCDEYESKNERSGLYDHVYTEFLKTFITEKQ